MKKKEENAEFIKTLEMKDKNAAAIKVVSNSIKYIKKNGWQSDGWSGQGKQKAKKCLVGALLEGAGFAIKNGSTYCDIKGETCNADELLFGELPGLRKSAYKILNAHLDEYIEENKVKDKERTLKEKAYYAIKNPTLKQENAFYKSLEKIDNNETFMRVEDLKNKKLNKSDMNSADAISQSIQDFNDEVLYSQEKALSFLTDVLQELNLKKKKHLLPRKSQRQ